MTQDAHRDTWMHMCPPLWQHLRKLALGYLVCPGENVTAVTVPKDTDKPCQSNQRPCSLHRVPCEIFRVMTRVDARRLRC
jgi:hypothetical protein